jgi:hypothetical protein
MVVPLNVVLHDGEGLAVARPSITSLRVRSCVDSSIALEMSSAGHDAVLFAQVSDIEHLIGVLQRACEAASLPGNESDRSHAARCDLHSQIREISGRVPREPLSL